jgi:hypothetical protein
MMSLRALVVLAADGDDRDRQKQGELIGLGVLGMLSVLGVFGGERLTPAGVVQSEGGLKADKPFTLSELGDASR